MNSIKINLTNSESELPMCSSKMWGSPDLPTTFDFPTYKDEDGEENHYDFVCQINLAESAPFDIDNRLPHKGMLYFFARIGYYFGDFFEKPFSEGLWGKDGVKVYYYPKDDIDNFQTMILIDDDDMEIAFKEQKIIFSSQTENGEQMYDEHKLLGSPAYLSDEVDTDKYTLLFQLDSCTIQDEVELNFMDCGMFYFLIPIADLIKPSFKNVRGFLASS